MSACARLGVKSVAVHSEADRTALHVLYADQAVLIGPPPSSESYLRIDRVIDAAKRTGAEIPEGEKVLLFDSKDRRYLVTLVEGGEFHTHKGVLAHDLLIGRPEGSVVENTTGHRPPMAEAR